MPVATSNVTHTILDSSMDPIEGVLVRAVLMPGPGFRNDDDSEIARTVETESDSNGDWTLALERQANIVPSGTYYVVDEFIPFAKGGPARYAISVPATNEDITDILT